MNSFNILTHHKCASTWLSRYIHDFCSLNEVTYFQTHLSNLLPPSEPDVCLLINASHEFVSRKLERGLHVIRNPLDLLLSAYHSHKTTHPTDDWPELVAQRTLLQTVDAHDGLHLTLAFLERDDFYSGAVGPLHALRHWDFDDTRYRTIRMEDLVREPSKYLGPSLRSHFPNAKIPDDNAHSFEAVTGREIGTTDENSHYRSGRAGEWRNVLPYSIVGYLQAHYFNVFQGYYADSLA